MITMCRLVIRRVCCFCPNVYLSWLKYSCIGEQLQVFNSQAQIQIGGKWSKGKSRIERPFTGVLAGIFANGLRILDLAAEKDIHTSIRGDVQLMTAIPDKNEIEHNDLQKMQQVIPILRVAHFKNTG